MITRQNYELFFINYLEGRLGEAEVQALMSFLEEHPDLRTELENFQEMELVAEEISYEGKELLKRELFEKGPIKQANFAEFCIAYYEGSLSPRLENELKEFVFLNPELENDFTQYSRVYLKADSRIQFPNKKNLKRGKVVFFTPLAMRSLAVAASLAMLAGIYFLSPDRDPASTQVQTMADVQTVPPDSDQQPGIKEGMVREVKPDASLAPVMKGTEENRIASIHNEQLITSPAQQRMEERLTRMSPLSAGELTLEQASLVIQSQAQPSPSILFSGTAGKPEPLTLSQYAVREFREKILKENLDIRREKISGWDVAGYGINAFNKITGSDVRFNKQYSDQGELVAIAIDSKNFGISRSLKNN